MEAILEATPRDSFGKNEARRIRASGKVPGVLYGGENRDATPISVLGRTLSRSQRPPSRIFSWARG